MVLGKVVAKEACLVGCRQQLQAVLIELAQRLTAAVDPIEHATAHFTHSILLPRRFPGNQPRSRRYLHTMDDVNRLIPFDPRASSVCPDLLDLLYVIIRGFTRQRFVP